MAIVQTILHANPSEVAGPADLLMDVNRQLCRKKIGGFVTAFLGIYEPDARRLVYASAGHPPPLVRAAADGKVAQLDAACSHPLGIDATNPLKSATVDLHEGTRCCFTPMELPKRAARITRCSNSSGWSGNSANAAAGRMH